MICYFFFNDTATTEIYTLSLHDALPICYSEAGSSSPSSRISISARISSARETSSSRTSTRFSASGSPDKRRSEEHTSELQSRQYLVCRLLLEKKKYTLTLPFHSIRSCSF